MGYTTCSVIGTTSVNAPINFPSEFKEAFTLGLNAHNAGDWATAATHYRAALVFLPTSAPTINNLGAVTHKLGEVEEAKALVHQALALDPHMPEAWCNLGYILSCQLHWPEAEAAMKQAYVRLPNDPLILSNLGDVLLNLGRLAEAEGMLRKALWHSPAYPKAHLNLGMVYWGQRRYVAAEAELQVALALSPQLALARSNLGALQLAQGKYAEGWGNYDWRFVAGGRTARPWTLPLWTGQPLSEAQELVVWAEQGLGDEILQLRQVAGTQARLGAGALVWECDSRLAPLARRAFPEITILPRTDPLEPRPLASCQIPALSLGHFLPAPSALAAGAYLSPDPSKVSELRARLNLAPGERLIGLSWKSENERVGERKSTKLADWAGILATPGCRFIDLQYGDTVGEREGASILEHLDGLDLRDDLESLAALISCCSLVITVSNTTAHLSGALGVPTWVLVPKGMGSLWYWGVGEDPDWYSSVRVFRQLIAGNWTTVLADVAPALKLFVGERAEDRPPPLLEVAGH